MHQIDFEYLEIEEWRNRIAATVSMNSLAPLHHQQVYFLLFNKRGALFDWWNECKKTHQHISFDSKKKIHHQWKCMKRTVSMTPKKCQIYTVGFVCMDLFHEILYSTVNVPKKKTSTYLSFQFSIRCNRIWWQSDRCCRCVHSATFETFFATSISYSVFIWYLYFVHWFHFCSSDKLIPLIAVPYSNIDIHTCK